MAMDLYRELSVQYDALGDDQHQRSNVLGSMERIFWELPLVHRLDLRALVCYIVPMQILYLLSLYMLLFYSYTCETCGLILICIVAPLTTITVRLFCGEIYTINIVLTTNSLLIYQNNTTVRNHIYYIAIIITALTHILILMMPDRRLLMWKHPLNVYVN